MSKLSGLKKKGTLLSSPLHVSRVLEWWLWASFWADLPSLFRDEQLFGVSLCLRIFLSLASIDLRPCCCVLSVSPHLNICLNICMWSVIFLGQGKDKPCHHPSDVRVWVWWVISAVVWFIRVQAFWSLYKQHVLQFHCLGSNVLGTVPCDVQTILFTHCSAASAGAYRDICFHSNQWIFLLQIPKKV